MKTISVLFIKYDDTTSNILETLFQQKYTHCSIGLGKKPNQYYSFNYHGFACETMDKYKRSGIGNVNIIHIRVKDSIYTCIEKRVHEFEEHKKSYFYTRLGVVFCVLHLPFHRKNHYFCSQFVAELLELTQCMKFKKRSYQYLPYQLQQELTHSYAGIFDYSITAVRTNSKYELFL